MSQCQVKEVVMMKRNVEKDKRGDCNKMGHWVMFERVNKGLEEVWRAFVMGSWE